MPDNTAGIIRTAIYCRVSSDDQKERGTITSQITALRQLAPNLGLEIIDEYLDDGVSGTLALDKRPEGHRMMEDAEAGRFSVVLFYKVDRLARSLRYLLDTVDYFDSIKVSLRCATEPFETETLVGRMFVQLMGSFAEMERGMILERTTRGRDRVAAEGRWTGGPIPYGYRLDGDGKLIPNWTPREGYPFSEAEIAQRIFQWIGNEQGSAISAAKRLNGEGIPMWRKYQPKGKADPDYRSTATAAWRSTTIARIIRAPIYKGVHIFNGDIERPVTALVDQDVWDRAQAQLISNRNLSTRDTDRKYLLRSLVTCADCGAAYSGMSGSNRYYRCGSQIGSHRASTTEFCNAKMIRADWIEDMVWDVSDVASTEGLLRSLQDTIEGPSDWETRRSVIEGLVSGVLVETTGTKRQKKSKISVTYNFEPVDAAETLTPRRGLSP